MSDVAQHAGVSLKTVSRVLNNEPHVQSKLREKVRAAVRDLGYVPSASARSLRSNRSYCMTLISHSLHSSFVHAIQFGALEACQNGGYRMNVAMLDPEAAKNKTTLEAWCKRLATESRPDGVILVPPMSDDPAISAAIAQHGIAIVRIGPNEVEDQHRTVMINDHAAAKEATAHLIALGHRRIGFVRGKEDQGATHKRFEGYADALSEADIALDDELVLPGLFDFETGLAAGDKFLKMPSPPTAVFAANDDMAAGVLVAAHRLGVPVPTDLSIIGFDDSEIAEKMWPALTTVRQPLQELGARAMEVLIESAGRRQDEVDLVPPECLQYELVLRQSTAAPGA